MFLNENFLITTINRNGDLEILRKNFDENGAFLAQRDRELTEAQRMIEKLMKEKDKLVDNLQKAKLECQMNAESIANSERVLKEKDADLAVAHANLAELSKKLTTQSDRLKNMEAAFNSRGEEMDKLRGEMANKQHGLENEINDLKKELSALKTSRSQDICTRDKLLHEIEDISRKLRESQVLIPQKDAAVKAATTRADKLTDRIADLQEELESFRKAQREKDDTINKLSIELAAANRGQGRMNGQISNLEAELARTVEAKDNALAELEEVSTDLTVLKEENEGLDKNLHDALDEIARYTAEISDFKSKLASTTEAQNGLNEFVKKLQAELDALKIERDELYTQATSLQRDIKVIYKLHILSHEYLSLIEFSL